MIIDIQGIIGIPRPTRFNVPWEFVESLVQVKIPVISEAGSFVEQNRNKLMERARECDSSFLLMIDPDSVFTVEDVEKIAKHMTNGLDVVAGMCKRGGDKSPSVYKKIEECEQDYEIQTDLVDGLNEVGAVGGAFLAINKHVIEKMQDNPFGFIEVSGFRQGEDISFCHKAREHGFKIWCDTTIRIGHIRHEIIW